MNRFSYKVNQRRRIRQLKRQSAREIIAPVNDSSSSTCSDETDKSPLRTSHQQQESHEKILDMSISNQYESLAFNCNQFNNDTDWISEEEYEEDERPLYYGSSINVIRAVRRITDFYLNINLDKEKVNSLLRLIKSLLPKPNLLPSTIKRTNKILNYIPSTSTRILCSDCYSLCNKTGIRSQMCVNQNCPTPFRVRDTTEIIEIVRFDIRSQIQCIMNRNVDVLNQSNLFPPRDVVFGEQYQKLINKNSNQISLIIHSDGAPIVKSSKKSIWPCVASIAELPPPVRELQSNIIVLALWLSKKKPNVNVFLEETVNDVNLLIQNGTTIFIGNEEYKIQLRTQFFISDLPAKALFCYTTYFNGYSACTYCCSKGKLFLS